MRNFIRFLSLFALILMFLIQNPESVSAVSVGSNVEYQPPTRNVGFGVIDPAARLEINGQIMITGGNPAADAVLTSDANGLASWEKVSISSIDNDLIVNGAVTANNFIGNGSQLTGITVANVDNANTANVANFATSATKAKTLVSPDGNTTVAITNNVGNLGINTNSPQSLLHVNSINEESDIAVFGAEGRSELVISDEGSGNNHYFPQLKFTGSNDIFSTRGIAGKMVGNTYRDIQGGPGSAVLIFETNFVGAQIENADLFSWTENGNTHMFMNADGNLALGTGDANPSEKLEVGGNVKADNFIGNGSQLTGITVANIGNADTANTADFATSAGAATTADSATTATNLNGGTITNISSAQITGSLEAKILGLGQSSTEVEADIGLTSLTSYMRIQGKNGPANISFSPQIELGSVPGQTLTIRGLSDTNTVTFEDGDGLVLDAGVSFELGNKDILTFVYDSIDQVWIETGRIDR